MPISPVSVGAAVTPTVIKTYISHYTNRTARKQKPTAHISYDEGLHLIRSFLVYASHHTVDDLQAFTSQWVPSPSWVKTENVTIPQACITDAADRLIAQLGPTGVEEVGGVKWWQWRQPKAELKAEWIEMRADFNARKQLGEKSRRVMLYVHGGAYFFGSVDEHRYQMQRHARKLKARVFAPRYRLAPQFPFPCGLQDCLAAYLYLLTVNDKTEIILAGDSAGGGMILSIMCLLRDQDLPLPAGAILISPWVDLTHSFPSVAAENNFDYIPAHGFMHKPSVSWPPPNDDEMDAIHNGTGKELLKDRNKLEKKEVEREAAQGFTVREIVNEDAAAENKVLSDSTNDDLLLAPPSEPARDGSNTPGPKRHLQLKMDNKIIELKDQIQMYTTNQLLSHPMVSPVLQPSLGGLPPLLILVGGGEMLRDEQIYVAHKAAHPQEYPLGDEYRARHDPGDKILDRYKPTPVQLQVWDDLCHVAPTLSFTRPAKFMYRSIAQFGAWALARAQHTGIDIVDDDSISIISTDSEQSRKRVEMSSNSHHDTVGKAGDPIPNFKHHMIRQRIDRHGSIRSLEEESKIPALQLAASEVGVIKVGPVKKWMTAKLEWDTKYARVKRKVQKRRIAELVKADSNSFEGECPPPSALAGRKKDMHLMTQKPRKSYWLAIWSGWGSKHDEDTIKRGEEIADHGQDVSTVDKPSTPAEVGVQHESSPNRMQPKTKPQSRSRSRNTRRLTTVSDIGQVEGEKQETDVSDFALAGAQAPPKPTEQAPAASGMTRSESTTDTHLTPLFIPKFKTAPHLRADSKDNTDASSIRTGHSMVIPDNASTRAVFSAAGVSKDSAGPADEDGVTTTPGLVDTADNLSDRGSLLKMDDRKSAFGGYDTPYSRRSVERLMSHQVDLDGASIAGTEQSTRPNSIGARVATGPFRSPSTTAVIQHEGIVDVVEGGLADVGTEREDELTPTEERQMPNVAATKVFQNGEVKLERPGLYDPRDSDFQTAMEHL